MREELDQPCVGQRVEAATNVTIQLVVHRLPRQGDRERVERLVRTVSRSEPTGEPPKILLVHLGEDGDHGLLDERVFQGGEAQGALPPIGLRDRHSPCGLRSIAPAVNSTLEIDQPIVQAGLIQLPGHASPPGAACRGNA
jgi:hypothetical protein